MAKSIQLSLEKMCNFLFFSAWLFFISQRYYFFSSIELEKLGNCLIYYKFLAFYDYLMESRRKLSILDNNFTNKDILTSREIEYLSLVALGYKNNVIAQTLSVTQSTVKKTLENIFKKLKAKDRTNAVTIAFVHNFLSVQNLYNFIENHNLK